MRISHNRSFSLVESGGERQVSSSLPGNPDSTVRILTGLIVMERSIGAHSSDSG